MKGAIPINGALKTYSLLKIPLCYNVVMTWNICGHETAVAFLKEHTQPEKLRHAYLITGPQGIGRRTLSLAFIKALNCLNPPQAGEFCNSCIVCRQINAQTFSDLTVLTPIPGNKDLRIDQIRTMQQSLALAPYQAKYRTILIPDMQKATASASNALLKSLEEPPARAILVLTADAQESLLETIASRCEILRLRPLPVPVAEKSLVENFGLSRESAKRLAHLCGGRIGTALRFEQNPDLLLTHNNSLDLLDEMLSSNKRHRLQFAESQTKLRTNLRETVNEMISAWITYWRDVLILHNNALIPLVNEERIHQIQKVAQALEPGKTELILFLHEKALDQLDRYINPRLVLENVLLQLPTVRM